MKNVAVVGAVLALAVVGAASASAGTKHRACSIAVSPDTATSLILRGKSSAQLVAACRDFKNMGKVRWGVHAPKRATPFSAWSRRGVSLTIVSGAAHNSIGEKLIRGFDSLFRAEGFKLTRRW